MKSVKYVFVLVILAFFTLQSSGQTTSFELEDYRLFLENHQNMTSTQLLEMNPAGKFNKKAGIDWESALYHDSIEIKYELTDEEKICLKNMGSL